LNNSSCFFENNKKEDKLIINTQKSKIENYEKTLMLLYQNADMRPIFDGLSQEAKMIFSSFLSQNQKGEITDEIKESKNN